MPEEKAHSSIGSAHLATYPCISQEVVGSGIAINLLSNARVPVWAGCIITGLDTFTFLAVHYLGVRYLEALICLLIGTISFCFFLNWGYSPPTLSLIHI